MTPEAKDKTRHQDRWANFKVALPYIIGMILLAIFVWPTQWMYFTSGDVNYRTERITGETQVLSPSGWQQVGSPPASSSDNGLPVPSADLSKITIDTNTCSWSEEGMEIEIYNGSSYTLKSVTVPVTLLAGNSPVWIRNYIFSQSSMVPNKSYKLYNYEMPTIPSGDNWLVGNPVSASAN